jgi:preprotein translocase subunit YajC
VSGLEQLLPFVLIFVVFWLLLIRPQRKRQQELVRTQGSVEVGDEVMLGAGIAGRVAEAGEEFLQLEIAPGVQMKVARQAVVRVLAEEPATHPELDDDEPTERPDTP